MLYTKRSASALGATILFALAAACGGDDGNVLTDTTAAGGSLGAPAAVEQAEHAEDRVEVALSTDTTLRAFGLDADDDDDRVVLKGVVNTEEQKALAAQVASREAAGLTIENRIRVDARRRAPNQIVDVDEVEDRVEEALEADSVLKQFDLEADEEDGQIVLEGTVRSADQRTRAEEIAKRIAGTVAVVNRVRVQP